jgi:PAS domain S-box-containing protein
MTLKKTIEGAIVAMVNVDQLKRNEERLRLLVEQMVAGIAENDMSGRFTRVNQRYCEIIGYTRDELLKMTVTDISHPQTDPTMTNSTVASLPAARVSLSRSGTGVKMEHRSGSIRMFPPFVRWMARSKAPWLW